MYKPGPGLPHNNISLVKPIYCRLSNNALLSKCLDDGKTQNQNESFNGMIWNRLPKSTFVELGVYDAVAHFNMGSRAAINILQEEGLNPGFHLEEGICRADKKRIKKAHYRATPEVKKKRKVLRGHKKKKEDKNKEVEGNTYEAGAF